jgi:hypothetical protein
MGIDEFDIIRLKLRSERAQLHACDGGSPYKHAPSRLSESKNAKTPPEDRGCFCMFGGVLLFHPNWAVPSALTGLASGFGMGPGVSLSL